MLDAMGKLNGEGTAVPAGYKMDGDSLLCLLDGQADPRVPTPASSCRGGKWRYNDFDIILAHLARVFQPSTTPIAPCDIFYLRT